MELEGKVALVTGSAQGIGRAIAVRLAQEGAEVIVGVRVDDSRAAGSLAQIEAAGRRGCIVAGDLRNTDDARRVVEEGVRRMGKIDLLINNAGVEKRAAFWDVTEADYDLVLDANLKGTFFATQAFVRHLRDMQRPGKIINVSSVHEELPFPHFTSYCCSKGALKMFMRNLAIELAPLGITVNNIAPGAIETPINRGVLSNPALLKTLLGNIPLKRLGQPMDVAGLAAFLASSDADYMTGTTLFVDGGLLWKYSEQ
jgi:glucose 1-dehydrogenase